MADAANGADSMAMFPQAEPLSDEVPAATCPVTMGGRPDGRCGRPVHAAPAGVDARPVCLMHSRDEDKAAGTLMNAFIEEVRVILTEAGTGDAHFDGFVFSKLSARGVVFPPNCIFDGAVFAGELDLYQSTFQQKASFAGAQFESKVVLWETRFQGEANFRQANFSAALVALGTMFPLGADFSGVVIGGGTAFYQAEFEGVAQFENARFEGDVSFSGTRLAEVKFAKATFAGNASLSATEFRGEADFIEATFAQEANFRVSSFAGRAHFGAVTFGGRTTFTSARFERATYFRGATFGGAVDFSGVRFADLVEYVRAEFEDVAVFAKATFKGEVHGALARYAEKVTYTEATFEAIASWASVTFVKGAEFRSVRFEPVKGGASALFAFATFGAPDEVVFHDVDLSRVLFHNCDVSEVRFTSSARWGERSNHQGALIYEETVELEGVVGRPLRRNGMRDYGAVAQIYQQLKKNYDGRLDYWTANEFHFGEMEMRRLDVPSQGPLLKLRQWWKPQFGLVAWYRYASDYGNSYVKPLVWMVVLLMGFAAVYPLPGVGLARSGMSGAETYANVWQKKATTVQNAGLELELVGRSLLAAIDVAGFQKSPEYSPSYPWGRVLGIVETVLTSTLFGLFLLAIRRQFRR